MSTTKHTPKPWAVQNQGPGCSISVIAPEAPGMPFIAHVLVDDIRSEAQALANGVLMAAAPDLLEALQDILYAEPGYPWGGYSEEEIAARAKAEAAIAKATQSRDAK